jgi:hypothetical protein
MWCSGTLIFFPLTTPKTHINLPEFLSYFIVINLFIDFLSYWTEIPVSVYVEWIPVDRW